MDEAVLEKEAATTRRSAPAKGRPQSLTIEQEELRGVSRTVAEIHWLLVILVLLYVIFAKPGPDSEPAISAALFFYAAFVMGFRYANLFREETRWKIALETWAMIAVITWVVWFSGKLASPLLNAYLLAVITSSLTLGKLTTLSEVALIAACYVYLAGGTSLDKLASLAFVGDLAAQLAPVLLVAYITTLFSADIRYGLARAKLLSETDELTGLFNRRGFAIAANRLFAQAVRYERPASVLMLDSDSLKAVNDEHGHDAGNRLLRQIAAAIRAELRYTDVSARYGGDEFVVLLPETPLKGALEVAERIRTAVSSTPLEAGGARIASSVSIGVACFPGDGHSLDALANRADHALYQAKNQGRNRVEHYKPG